MIPVWFTIMYNYLIKSTECPVTQWNQIVDISIGILVGQFIAKPKFKFTACIGNYINMNLWDGL